MALAKEDVGGMQCTVSVFRDSLSRNAGYNFALDHVDSQKIRKEFYLLLAVEQVCRHLFIVLCCSTDKQCRQAGAHWGAGSSHLGNLQHPAAECACRRSGRFKPSAPVE